MQITHVHQVAQHASDLDRATIFYRDVLGLRHVATFDPPGLVFLAAGGTRILLERQAPPALLYLAVDDLDAAWAALGAAGVELADPPHRIFDDSGGMFGSPAEEWMAFFRDSEGNLVGLVERRPR